MGKAKLNIPMCAALVLLFLTMVSVHLTSGLYARYTATATGSDSARVAKFDVTGNGSQDVTVDCTQADDTGKYSITVTSNSEVAVTYTITVTFERELAATDLLVRLDETYMSGKQVTITGNMAPNAGTKTHTLEIQMLNWAFVTQYAPTEPTVVGQTTPPDRPVAQWTLDFAVNIDVQQVD